LVYLRKKTVKDEGYLYLVKSLWDSKKKTSKQAIIKYLGKESLVTIDDIPEDYRESEKITNYFNTRNYFQPKNHYDAITKTRTDLLLSFRECDVIGAYSLYESYEKIYGSEEFLEKIFKQTIEEIEKSQDDDLVSQAVIYKTAEELLSIISKNSTLAQKNKKILICLPYGEQHTMGSKVIESELSLRGNVVYNVPPLTSTLEILETINEKNPDCIFISVTLEENIIYAKRLIEKIKEDYKNSIYVGGQAFTQKNQKEEKISNEEKLKKICALINSKKKI
jgi:methanogenic corrinoid protein MtbC1